ncbi:hypothetical protein KOAAANKH_02877 [Brevundimonas sp. NIBR10]|nr:hypothetical protein KOAAANKH_02877 [Brevundimonas sp. NIBR10]
MGRHLAQLNLARLTHPMDGPEMADFVAALDNINALAERSSGFVWRLVGDGDDATDVRAEGFDDVLVNMSVWSGIEPLRQFVYKTAHAAVMARRSKWFPSFGGAYYVLWWIDEGHVPTVAEAVSRLRQLDAEGDGPDAFTFDRPFAADGAPLALPEIIKDCA